MRLRFIGIVSLLAALLALVAGVARALDFDDEDPHPPRAEIGLLYHYEIGRTPGAFRITSLSSRDSYRPV
jgi:hypothetical protein